MEYEVLLKVQVPNEYRGAIDKITITNTFRNLFECVDLKGVENVEITNVKRCN